jgi:hypothetical protein
MLEIYESVARLDLESGMENGLERFDTFVQEQADELTVSSVDLLSDDDSKRRAFAVVARPPNLVVVSDSEDIESSSRETAFVVGEVIRRVI